MTNAELITELARMSNDPTFQKRSRSTYASILTMQQDFLVDKFDLVQKVDSSSLTLAANTDPVGNMPADYIKFSERANDMRSGQIAIGTNGKVPLKPISIEELDLYQANWRSATAGTPEFFYEIQGSVIQLGIFPKASSAWITTNGSAVYIYYVYRPDAITDTSNNPFGNTTRFRGLEDVLLLRGRRHTAILDKERELAADLSEELKVLLVEKGDLIRTILAIPRAPRFDPRWKV